MSTRAAPTSSAMTMPSPVAPGEPVLTVPLSSGLYLTIMSSLLPNPPVVRITAFALIVYLAVLPSALTPVMAPSVIINSVAFVSYMTLTPRASIFFRNAVTRYAPTPEPSSGE